MVEKKKYIEIGIFSFYVASVFALIGGAFEYGVLFAFLTILIFSGLFVLLLITYLCIRSMFLRLFERWREIIEEFRKNDSEYEKEKKKKH